MKEGATSSRDRGLLVFFALVALLTVVAWLSSSQQWPGNAASGGGSVAVSHVSPTPTNTAAPMATLDHHGPPATPPPPARTPAPAAATGCGSDPMGHVYDPDRLDVLNPCVRVAGTIADIRPQADGDYHVMIALDAGQTCGSEDCLDQGNRQLQQSYLVVEVVCAHGVTQHDAMATCSQYHNNLAVPGIGSHVTVLGPWVHDVHGWNEIHPVVSFGS